MMANCPLQVVNLAHRGASGHAPENTMAAFHLAEQLGADGLELDVQLTSDGVPVVIHDESLQRTTNGRGWVHERTWAEIKALDAGAWFGRSFAGERIPTLEEVIATFGERMILNIELKNSIFEMPGLEAKTIELLRRYRMEQKVIISSFNHESMLYLHQMAPDLRIGLLYDCCLVGAVDYAKRIGASALHPMFGTVKPGLVRSAHEQGIDVNVWTVNAAEQMRRLIVDAHVDAIITNYPERLRQVLDSLQAGQS